jgi:hypothetical protein
MEFSLLQPMLDLINPQDTESTPEGEWGFCQLHSG